MRALLSLKYSAWWDLVCGMFRTSTLDLRAMLWWIQRFVQLPLLSPPKFGIVYDAGELIRVGYHRGLRVQNKDRNDGWKSC